MQGLNPIHEPNHSAKKTTKCCETKFWDVNYFIWKKLVQILKKQIVTLVVPEACTKHSAMPLKKIQVSLSQQTLFVLKSFQNHVISTILKLKQMRYCKELGNVFQSYYNKCLIIVLSKKNEYLAYVCIPSAWCQLWIMTPIRSLRHIPINIASKLEKMY